MTNVDYYANIHYRNKIKHYHVTAENGNDIRVEYVDYNPYREWHGVWITNGKSRIIEIFDNQTSTYHYYKSIKDKFDKTVSDENIKGTLNLYSCYKRIVKSIQKK